LAKSAGNIVGYARIHLRASLLSSTTSELQAGKVSPVRLYLQRMVRHKLVWGMEKLKKQIVVAQLLFISESSDV
jgi:hypothetical protein